MTTPAVARAASPEQSRARDPDASGFVERDGIRVWWERYGEGSPTILLMPTWSIAHSRHWKAQIAYLARHFRVVTFDGRGNGRSDRPTDSVAYAGSAFVGDAVAVLDATGTDRAVLAGLSMGAGYALQVAATHPDRVLGVVLIGSSLSLDPEPSMRPGPEFTEVRERYDGWEMYNARFWRQDWAGFAGFFFGQVFSEPHSTKQIEDMVAWALETDPETMIAAESADHIDPPATFGPSRDTPAAVACIRHVTCPAMVIHGEHDQISDVEVGRRLATLLGPGARLEVLAGAGHAPTARDPVKVNLLIREFVRAIAPRARTLEP